MKHLKTLITLFLLVIGMGTSWAEFKDFEIDLKVKEPTIPSGVTKIAYLNNYTQNFNDAQHGWHCFAIEFSVDGPVDITIGGCNYQGVYYASVVDESGTTIQEIKNDKCGNIYTYNYTGSAQKLKLYCGQYCPLINVQKASEGDFTASWDWTKQPEALKTEIAGVMGMLSADNGTKMYVDATNNGRLTDNTGNAQFIADTRLLVPVYGLDDEITVVGFPNLTSYSVHGETYTSDETFKVNADDVAQGYIVIKAVEHGYLKTVTLKHTVPSAHYHNFATKWSWNTTHHYHECTAEGCDIKDYGTVTGEDATYVAYGEHTYGQVITDESYFTCSVCEYKNESRKADYDAVNDVIDKIDAIGDVVYDEVVKARIDVARSAYNNLTEAQRKLVTNYNVLTLAETTYEALTPLPVPARQAIWNWKVSDASTPIIVETQFTNEVGYVHSDIQGILLQADASKGSFKASKVGKVCAAILSKGSSIMVPIRREGDRVTIVCPDDLNNYSVHNEVSDATEKTYVATQDDCDKGYMLITAVDETHFYSITVTQKKFTSVLPEISLNSAGWASFTSLIKGSVLACPLGYKAYVATDVDDEYVTLTRVKTFGYGDGVFIQGDRLTQMYAINVKATESDVKNISNNLTEGVVKDKPVYSASGAYVLATNTKTGVAGFFRVTTTMTVPVGRACFFAPDDSNGAKELKIRFADEEETTGIESILAGGETTVPTAFYNLSGQKVSKDYKGIVIGNDGKKYVK